MGVYIKGMEMPKRCIDCPFMVSDDDDNCVLQAKEANAHFTSWEDMKANCPLVEIKASHDDLIDRGDLLAFLNENLSTHPEALSWSDYGVIDLIEARPTVLEAEGKDDG